MKYHCDNDNYIALFNEQTGLLIRASKDKKEPFWKPDGPELLDISITNYCERECDFCYRQSNIQGKSMSLDVYRKIINQAKKAGVFQVALGGGNPNQHPDFIEILRIARESGIVPSFTTNGQGMTDAVFSASKKYAGAIAVSWYKPYSNARRIIQKCREFDIPVNIHFVLNGKNVKDALQLLNNDCVKDVNSIIFLNYKPLGKIEQELLRESNALDDFFNTILHFSSCKIGFDSCMISFLVPYLNKIDTRSIDFCEAARFSAFISENGKMYPCSFMCGSEDEGISIETQELSDIWKNGKSFVRFREILKEQPLACRNCSHYTFCCGGCRRYDINRCGYIEDVGS